MLPVLTGVRIEIAGSNISLLATDRFRLSLRELTWDPQPTDVEAHALVPARVLRSVLARRPDWTGRVLDDRRHALMLEDPEVYLEEFARWRDATNRAA